MEKLIIKSEKKPWQQKKPCVGVSEDVYNRLKELSEETGKSMTVLANIIFEFGFKNICIVEE